MKHLLLYACMLIAIIAGIMMFIREPLVFICWVGGWIGWLYFRCQIATEDEPVGKPTSHRPRTKLPDDYR